MFPKFTMRSPTCSLELYKEEEEEDAAKLQLYLKPMLGFVYP
jgi:hypothetical protein